VGECNLYSVEPRGRILCIANDGDQLTAQVRAATSVGNRALVLKGQKNLLGRGAWLESVTEIGDIDKDEFDAVLFSGAAGELVTL
ncbi:hypothetical protein ABTM35_19910, partial [Acinetobacter baumannii]